MQSLDYCIIIIKTIVKTIICWKSLTKLSNQVYLTSKSITNLQGHIE